MTPEDLDNFLHYQVLSELDYFAETLYKEFYINWKKQHIIFFGKPIIKYYIFDKDGNEVLMYDSDRDPNTIYDICDSIVFTQNLEDDVIEKDNYTLTHVRPSITSFKDLKIGLRDSNKLNAIKVQEWLKYVKNEVLKTDLTLLHDYWQEESYSYNWSRKVVKHIADIQKILLEYQSAAMEPDGNIMIDCKRRIITELEKFDKQYDDYWPMKSE